MAIEISSAFDSRKNLGDLCKVRTGKRDANFGVPGGKYPFFTCAQFPILANEYSFDSEAILIAGNGDVGHVQYFKGKFEAYQRTYVLDGFHKNLFVPYIYAYLKTNLKSYLQSRTHGSTMPYIRVGDLTGFNVPLPTLEKQKAIYGQYELLESLETRRNKAEQLLNQLLHSIFIKMFGDPNANSNLVPTAPIEKLGKVTTGNTPARNHPEFYGNQIEWIKSDNLNNVSHFATKAKEFLSPEGAKIGRIVPPMSILVTCIAGSPSCIGNVALVDREVAFNQQINAITPFPDVDPYFLYSQVLIAKERIQRASTHSMKGMISKTSFEKILLLKPTYEEQKKFGEVFIKINRISRTQDKSTDEIDNLFQSALQRAFQ